MNRPKFKIGDKVKCMNDQDPQRNGPLKGEEFTITVDYDRRGGSSFIGFVLPRYLGSDEVRYGSISNWSIKNFELVEDISKW